MSLKRSSRSMAMCKRKWHVIFEKNWFSLTLFHWYYIGQFVITIFGLFFFNNQKFKSLRYDVHGVITTIKSNYPTNGERSVIPENVSLYSRKPYLSTIRVLLWLLYSKIITHESSQKSD